eukprot:gene2238-2412_t
MTNPFLLLTFVLITIAKHIHLQNGEVIDTSFGGSVLNSVNFFEASQQKNVLFSHKNDFLQLFIQVDFEIKDIISKTEKYYDIKIHTKNYVAHDGFLIYLSRKNAKKMIENWNNGNKKYIKWIGKVNSEHKTPRTTFQQKKRNSKQVYHIYFKSKCEYSCLDEVTQWSSQNKAKFTQTTLTSGRLEFSVGNDEALKELLNQEIIEWIEEEPHYEVFNYSANSVLQHGYNGVPEENKKEIWEKGITGKGQVVTILDTGADYTSCFFHEINKQPPPEDSCDSSRTKVIGFYRHMISELNRKTILGDHIGGHGSHVSGSVGGKILGAASEHLKSYQGAAPDAQLVIMSAGDSEYKRSIFTPSVFSDMFRPQKQCNSTIFTNSWGSTSTAYNAQTRNFDQHLYLNDDLLVLFAAGNSGPTSKTVGTPAVGKNVLTIGSSQTTPLGRFNSSSYFDFPSLTKLVVDAGYLKEGQDCCASTNSAVRGICCQTTIAQTASSYTPEIVSSFSSRGPTMDGRIKPDVLNVGDTIQSVHSDGNLSTFQCGDMPPDSANNLATLRTDAGTSMATPLSAGGSALVRQYYIEGWHVNGVKDIAKGIIPSGPLLKATMIHSGNRNSKGPTNNHGFGSITLKNVLRFQGGNFDLFIKDRQKISHQISQYHGFRATKSGSFKVTLAWYDPPASLTSGIILVNDLNLDVLINGIRHPGNGISDDYLNTVEQVAVNVTTNDVIDVIVRGNKVVTSNQTYALVITGDGITSQAIVRTCQGKSYSDPNVCNKKGYCSKTDTCVCYGGNFGTNCNDFQCYGKNKTDSNACSNNGDCTGANNCTCNTGYLGNACDIPTCFGIPSTILGVCSGYTCIGLNKCDCSKDPLADFLNPDCSQNAFLSAVIQLVFFGFIGFIGICFFACICCPIVTIVALSMGGFGTIKMLINT